MFAEDGTSGWAGHEKRPRFRDNGRVSRGRGQARKPEASWLVARMNLDESKASPKTLGYPFGGVDLGPWSHIARLSLGMKWMCRRLRPSAVNPPRASSIRVAGSGISMIPR